MGTPEFAVPSLDILLQHHYPVITVVTAPDKPRGRGQELSPTPVKRRALEQGIPVLQPLSLKDPGFEQQLRELHPGLIVVVAFRILPPQIITIPAHGAFNLHASLLPKYRGAAPINWALINGEKETGVTTFFLKEKVDTGEMLLQARTPIGAEEDAGDLHDRLAIMGADAVLRTVQLVETGKAVPHPQDDAQASAAPKIFKEDCRIRWDQPADHIHNFVRGLSPFPGAFAHHGGRLLKIFRTRVSETRATGAPGVLRVGSGALSVSTRDRMLDLIEVQQEGRRRMDAAEFLRGYPVGSGETLA